VIQAHVAWPMRPMYGNNMATLVRVGLGMENQLSNMVSS
jgi:hypothetical protein